MRMIENSTASVHSDTRDTALLLLLLLVFALSASGYVLYKGMQQGTQSRYQLLLHCILIITSVIPPELPMQTALAVNSSLMTLMKMQIFCTEPFRVPIAGKVDTCVFDKTGTLTTDELVAVGVVPYYATHAELTKAYENALQEHDAAQMRKSLKESATASSAANPTKATAATGGPGGVGVESPPPPPLPSTSTAGMTPMGLANPECTLVLGACHSLVLIDGKVGGDPLEAAALKAIKWELAPNAIDTSRPKPEIVAERPIFIRALNTPGDPAAGSHQVHVGSVKVLTRHHFSSKLQRMSVVARIGGDDSGAWALVKGSPEALAAMCIDCPADYNLIAGDLAKRGMRVIALGMRRLSLDEITSCCDSRAATEQRLNFVGFVSFTCRVRKDSFDVIRRLRNGGNVVAMATGYKCYVILIYLR